MRVIFVRTSNRPEVHTLDDRQDPIRQIAARFDCKSDEVLMKMAEICGYNFTLFYTDKHKSNTVTGIDSLTGKAVQKGEYIIAHYSKRTGLITGLNEAEIADVGRATDENGIINRFNHLEFLRCEAERGQKEWENSEEYKALKLRAFDMMLAHTKIDMIHEYTIGTQVLTDVFTKHPDLADAAAELPERRFLLKEAGINPKDVINQRQ